MDNCKIIVECFSNTGINDELTEFDLDVDLSECFVDSLIFMTFVIELEQQFNIEIPSEYLKVNYFSTLNKINALVDSLA